MVTYSDTNTDRSKILDCARPRQALRIQQLEAEARSAHGANRSTNGFGQRGSQRRTKILLRSHHTSVQASVPSSIRRGHEQLDQCPQQRPSKRGRESNSTSVIHALPEWGKNTASRYRLRLDRQELVILWSASYIAVRHE